MNHADVVANRRERLAALSSRADALLENRAVHDSVKVDVREAVKDLREAALWLDRAETETPRALAEVGFATYRIDMAAHRLDHIEALIREHGETIEFFR